MPKTIKLNTVQNSLDDNPILAGRIYQNIFDESIPELIRGSLAEKVIDMENIKLKEIKG